MRQLPWMLVLVVVLGGVCLGCRTRLPVDRPEVERVQPAPARSPWLASVEATERRPGERASPTRFAITTDRLRNLVTYRPLARPGDGPLGFVMRVDTCVPGEHDR